MIEMTIESVRINLATQQRVAILKAKTQERYLFIWIAHAEAYAIAVELQGTESPRPLTHDLLKSVIEGLGAKIVKVVVSDLVDDIFYASIVCDMAGEQVEFDARPSDAFALAVRAKAPVFVEEQILERAGVVLDSKEAEADVSDTEQKQEEEQEPEVSGAEQQEETETVTVDAESEEQELMRLRRENEGLKEQLRQLQDELGRQQ